MGIMELWKDILARDSDDYLRGYKAGFDQAKREAVSLLQTAIEVIESKEALSTSSTTRVESGSVEKGQNGTRT